MEKRRAEWRHWTGTPTDLAEIAQLAVDLVKGAQEINVNFAAQLTSPVLDLPFSEPQELRQLRADDLADLDELVIKADDQGSRRIAITIEPPRRLESHGIQADEVTPVVRLNLSATDRDWLDLAKLRMVERIDAGGRATGMVRNALLIIAGVLLAATIATVTAGGDKKEGVNPAEAASIVLVSVALACLVLGLFADAFAPRLELLDEGGITRWDRLKRLVRLSGRSLADRAITAAIGAVVGILIVRAFS